MFPNKYNKINRRCSVPALGGTPSFYSGLASYPSPALPASGLPFLRGDSQALISLLDNSPRGSMNRRALAPRGLSTLFFLLLSQGFLREPPLFRGRSPEPSTLPQRLALTARSPFVGIAGPLPSRV